MKKTIKEIADELGVSKQAVAYRLKHLESKNGVLAIKENGVLAVSLVGEKLIKAAFLEKNRQNFGGKKMQKGHQKETDILALLQATVDTLKEQLAIKDQQIDELNIRLAETTEALVSAQQTAQTAQALHAGTIQQQLKSGQGDSANQGGFFSRVLKRKKNNT